MQFVRKVNNDYDAYFMLLNAIYQVIHPTLVITLSKINIHVRCAFGYNIFKILLNNRASYVATMLLLILYSFALFTNKYFFKSNLTVNSDISWKKNNRQDHCTQCYKLS